MIKIEQIINEINSIYPNIDKNQLADEKLINQTELYIKHKIPKSYKKFLQNFSNGIFLLDCEPICGAGRNPEESPSGVVGFSSDIIPGSAECKIVNENKMVNRKNLIHFTAGSALDFSCDHWVFICDEEYEDNEYKVGYVSQLTGNVVIVLNNFEEWLTVFWTTNKNEDESKSVFYCLYPTFDNRNTILNL